MVIGLDLPPKYLAHLQDLRPHGSLRKLGDHGYVLFAARQRLQHLVWTPAQHGGRDRGELAI
jgi:hypothetical protein